MTASQEGNDPKGKPAVGSISLTGPGLDISVGFKFPLCVLELVAEHLSAFVNHLEEAAGSAVEWSEKEWTIDLKSRDLRAGQRSVPALKKLSGPRSLREASKSPRSPALDTVLESEDEIDELPPPPEDFVRAVTDPQAINARARAIASTTKSDANLPLLEAPATKRSKSMTWDLPEITAVRPSSATLPSLPRQESGESPKQVRPSTETPPSLPRQESAETQEACRESSKERTGAPTSTKIDEAGWAGAKAGSQIDAPQDKSQGLLKPLPPRTEQPTRPRRRRPPSGRRAKSTLASMPGGVDIQAQPLRSQSGSPTEELVLASANFSRAISWSKLRSCSSQSSSSEGGSTVHSAPSRVQSQSFTVDYLALVLEDDADD